jgi:O-antigen chain-terminating methyltransferase
MGRRSENEGPISGPPEEWPPWRELWVRDRRFVVRSHRRFWGRFIVGLKRLFAGVGRAPVADLFDRQRAYNLALFDRLGDLDRRLELVEGRVADLEGFFKVGIEDLMRYGDGLFTRVDLKLERYRRESRDHTAQLRSALAALEAVDGARTHEDVASVLRAGDLEHRYLGLEDRHRGTGPEVRQRLDVYLPYLRGCPGIVLDLGCGRGEALELLAADGIAARGVDASEEMVRRCRERGLAAERGDLLAILAALGPDTLGGILCFHVVEHLDSESVRRLCDLAQRALAPGGVLVLETPSALSLVAAGSQFWIDPTHRRPVHPEALRHALETSGFEQIEILPRTPFGERERLPEIELDDFAGDVAELADRVNRLRDRLDDVLYGFQDLGVVARKRR